VALYIDFKRQRSYGVVRFFLVLGLMLTLVYVPIYAIIVGGDADLARRLFMVVTSLNLTLLLFASDIINHTLWHTKGDDEEDE